MPPQLSVIVPVYNVAGYLDQCLFSIIGQSLKDMEIICVNDGSTDSSLEILNRYASSDSRIKILTHENNGYGYTMNRGIMASTGEYIAVVESDDYILPGFFSDLYKKAKRLDLDFIKSDYYRFTSDGKYKRYEPIAPGLLWYNKVMDPRECMGRLHLQTMTWLGIYKRDFLVSKEILHNESPGASFQDNGFWFQIYTQAERAYFVRKAYYMYRQDNPLSSIRSRNKVYTMAGEYDFIEEFLRKKGLFERYERVYWERRLEAYNFTLDHISEEFVEEFLQRFSADFEPVLESGILEPYCIPPEWWNRSLAIIGNPRGYYDDNYRSCDIISAGNGSGRGHTPSLRRPRELWIRIICSLKRNGFRKTVLILYDYLKRPNSCNGPFNRGLEKHFVT